MGETINQSTTGYRQPAIMSGGKTTITGDTGNTENTIAEPEDRVSINPDESEASGDYSNQDETIEYLESLLKNGRNYRNKEGDTSIISEEGANNPPEIITDGDANIYEGGQTIDNGDISQSTESSSSPIIQSSGNVTMNY